MFDGNLAEAVDTAVGNLGDEEKAPIGQQLSAILNDLDVLTVSACAGETDIGRPETISVLLTSARGG